MKVAELSSQLFRKHKIVVTTVKIEGEFPYEGIRITSNVYTTLGEIDALCEGVEQAVRDRGSVSHRGWIRDLVAAICPPRLADYPT